MRRCNKLARKPFAKVVVSNRTAVAVVPRPEFRALFSALPRPVTQDGEGCTGGNDGGRFRGCSLPLDALIVAPPAERRRVGRSRRDAYRAPRARTLTAEQVAAVLASRPSRTLRELAAEFGVSHETIRSVLRRPAARSARPG